MTAQQLRDLRTKLATGSAKLKAEMQEREEAKLRGELPVDIIRKTYVAPEEEPQEPAPRPRFGAMAPELAAQWDAWAQSLIRSALTDANVQQREYLDGVLKIVGDAIGEHARRLNDKITELKTEVGVLRAQLTLFEAVAKGRVVNIAKSKSNAA